MIIDLITGSSYMDEPDLITNGVNGNPYWDTSKTSKTQAISNYNYIVNHLDSLAKTNYPELVYEAIGDKTRMAYMKFIEPLPNNTVRIDYIRTYHSNDPGDKRFTSIKELEIIITIV